MATRHYYALVEAVGAGKGYSIWFPSFKGTTSHADTRHDVLRQATDALATVVEAMEAGGEALPLPYEDQEGGLLLDAQSLRDSAALLVPVDVAGRALRVNVSLNEGLLSRIDEMARRTGTSRSALLARGGEDGHRSGRCGVSCRGGLEAARNLRRFPLVATRPSA